MNSNNNKRWKRYIHLFSMMDTLGTFSVKFLSTLLTLRGSRHQNIPETRASEPAHRLINSPLSYDVWRLGKLIVKFQLRCMCCIIHVLCIVFNQVCRSHPYSFSADIWSMMCVLYQMLKGVRPWEQHHHSDRLVLLYKVMP